MLHYSKTSVAEIKRYSLNQSINIKFKVKVAIVDYNLGNITSIQKHYHF